MNDFTLLVGQLQQERVEEGVAAFVFFDLVEHGLVGRGFDGVGLQRVVFVFAQDVDAAKADGLEAVVFEPDDAVEFRTLVPEGDEDFLDGVCGVVGVAEYAFGE